MALKQEASTLIYNLLDDTVTVLVDLLKQINANMPKEDMHQKVTQTLE